MNIEKNHVVRFHYTLSQGGEPPLETSHGREPIAVLVGHGAIIPGLEQALIGRAQGDAFAVEIPAADAYGARRDGLVQRIAKKHLAGQPLVPGQHVVLNTSAGPRPVQVVKVGMSVVDVDMNHPLAGRDLRFEVEIIEVRAASAGEIAHGHVHGAGGHQH